MTTTITTASDGTEVRGFDEGTGPPVLVLHPGMDDGSSWERVSARLRSRFRVVRLHRRTYRLDLPAAPRDSMAGEVADTAAAARALGDRVILVGHSSGAVVALEALTAHPELFAGAVLYEPPAPIDVAPIGGEALERAKAALVSGRTGRATSIFMGDIVGYPRWLTWPLGRMVATVPGLRPRVHRQLVDCEAMDLGGVRTGTYAGIGVPVLFLAGERSPQHLLQRTEVLREAIPGARTAYLPGQGHSANQRRPDWVAEAVTVFSETLSEG